DADVAAGDPELAGDDAGGGDPPDLVDVGLALGEPQVPVRTGRDPLGAVVVAGDGELGDDPGCGDPPDHGATLGEPQVPVRPGRDPFGGAAGGDGELGNDPGDGDPPDLVADVLGEPQVP